MEGPSRAPDGRRGLTSHVGRPSLMDEADHFDSFVARESVRFLEDYARTDEPFLLVTSFLKPHDPFMPAKRFADMFRAEDMKLSPTWRSADLAHLPAEVRRFIETAPFTPELLEASRLASAWPPTTAILRRWTTVPARSFPRSSDSA